MTCSWDALHQLKCIRSKPRSSSRSRLFRRTTRLLLLKKRSMNGILALASAIWNTPCGSTDRQHAQRGANGTPLFQTLALSGGGRLEHRQNARMIQVTGSDAFKVRTDTAQFGGDKIVDKMQAPIQPGKQLILDVVVNR